MGVYVDLAGEVYQWDEDALPASISKELNVTLSSYASFQGAGLGQMILNATSGGTVSSPPRR